MLSNVIYRDFLDEMEKLEKIGIDNHLVISFGFVNFPVCVTIRPRWEEAAQEAMEFKGLEKEGFVTDPDAKIELVFAEDLKIRIDKDFAIEDALFNKIRTSAKKVYCKYLEHFFAQSKEQEMRDSSSD